MSASTTIPEAAAVAARAPQRNDDGYYVLPDDTHLMSVTTIIEHGIPKPGLVHWAAIEVARCAISAIPKLARLRGEAAREDAYQWLRRAAERKRDEAADLGSAVHDAVEAHVLGAPAPLPTDEQRPFLDAFHRFCDEHQPEFHAAEMVVGNPDDGWAGKLDVCLQLPRLGPAILLGDWKTGRKVYDEAALQLSAYRRATVGWLKDGTQVEPLTTEAAVVVHIRPDVHEKTGGYRLYQADTSDDVYASFLAARDVAYGWTRRRAKRAITVLNLPPLAGAA
ncbi:hypothetical protein [Pseudonocardia zijingensis]|uniref:PD-(D/E)XK nuclease superfamily protein n=1 Tax=Pseudonocardia zijingensis TaxID=153376 RepID=A0ABP3YMX7_9PSEU